MFTRTMIDRMILAFFVLVVVEVRGDVILPGEPIPEPNYKPDEIIVKFDSAVADSLAEQLAAGVPIEMLTLTESLDNLNSRYEARNIGAIFKSFYADRQRIEALLQKDEAGLTKRQKRLVRRLRRAPKDAKVPDLGRIYKLEFEPGQATHQAAATPSPGVVNS
ncbi:MAG: hypothetical protein FVQ85_15010 [Planctomycetes bacterium]|nr:hypothetical protein [Planctomycetota bacterium]